MNRTASQSKRRFDWSTEIQQGSDEMNLAEFPLASLADRAPSRRKTLVFEDQVRDSGSGEWVNRRLTVSGSDKYGLVQIGKAEEFASRRVFFSRYQLIDVLGWRNEGKSYRRLEKSLKRWLGITLYYDNAWWDKKQERWVDEHFYLIEHLVLYSAEQGHLLDLVASSDDGTSTAILYTPQPQLVPVVADPELDRTFVTVVASQNGTATIGPDGQSILFEPTPEFFGSAAVTIQATDGYGSSVPATITIDISNSPLVQFHLTPRSALLYPGESMHLSVVADFMDQEDVVLPASYLTFQSTDPSVATVDDNGQVVGVGIGNSVLVVSSHGIQTVTVVNVADPEDEYAFLD